MPRVRQQDFRQITGLPHGRHATQIPVWARWWRHRDGTVTHIHYDNHGNTLLAHRRDPDNEVFGRREAQS